MSHQDCTRKRVEIDGENWYLLVGSDFVSVTCPFENRPENIEKRLVLDRLCAEISAVMVERTNQ